MRHVPPCSALIAAALRREAADDRGEDQQRHAVADAALGDQLAHPHEQGGAGGEREHDMQHARHA